MYRILFISYFLLLSSSFVQGQISVDSYESLHKKADSLLYINPIKGLEYAQKVNTQIQTKNETYLKNLLILGKLQRESSQFKEALETFNEGLSLARDIALRIDFLFELENTYFSTGYQKKGFSYLRRAWQLADSLSYMDRKINMLSPFSVNYTYQKKWDSAAYLLNKLKPIAKKRKGLLLGDYHASLGYNLIIQNLLDSAKYHYLLAIEEYNKNNLILKAADMHRSISVLESSRVQNSEALSHLSIAEKTYQKLGIEGKLANIYINRAYIYRKTFRNDLAENYYEAALALFRENNNELLEAIVLINLSGLYEENLSDTKTALTYLDSALTVLEVINDAMQYPVALQQKANLLLQLDDYEKALIPLDNAKLYFEAKRDTIHLFENLTIRAKIYDALELNEIAESHVEKAQKLLFRIPQEELISSFYKIFLSNSVKLGRREDVLEILEKHNKQQKDKILEIRKNQVTDLQVAYETAKRDEQLSIEKANRETMELVLKEQKNAYQLTLIVAFTLLFLLFIVSYFVINLRKKTKQVGVLNERLIQQNEKLNKTSYDLKDKHEKVNQLNENLNYTNSILKIKKEHVEQLHHEMNYRIKNNLQSLSTTFSLQMDEMEGVGKSVFIEAQNRVDAMGLLHKSLYQNVQSPTHIDLLFFVEQLLTNIEKAYDLNVDIKKEVEISIPKIDVHLGIEMCLMLNEIVNNSIKYAFPDHQNPVLQVKISEKNSFLKIEVHDNGPGLPNDFSIENAESLGMKLIHSFVRKHEGKCTIKNDNGVRYEITLPYRESNTLV